MPLAAAMKPTFTSGSANVAVCAAMIISQDRAVSKPPPIAKPFTAAMTGFSKSNLWVKPAKPVVGMLAAPPFAVAFKSFPALKAQG